MGKEAQNLIDIAEHDKQQRASLLASARPVALDLVALSALAVAMLLWSASFIAMKLALSVFHPVFMNFARMLLSVLLLVPFLRHWTLRTPYARGDWRTILLMILAEPCLYFLFEAYALSYTTASQAGLITSLLPLLVGISAFFVLKERLAKAVWIGFAFAVGGVVLLTLAGENSEAAPNALLGNSLEFFAMIMACIYTLCVRKLRNYPPFFISAMQAAGGALFFGLGVAVLNFPLPETFPPLIPLLALGFLSFCSIVAYGLYNVGISRLSAGQAAAWTNLIPVLTLIMGIVFLHERLNVLQALAVPFILLGVFLTINSKRGR